MTYSVGFLSSSGWTPTWCLHININLGTSFPRIIELTWISAWIFAYLSPFILNLMRGSHWGGGFYCYKFWLFCGYRREPTAGLRIISRSSFWLSYFTLVCLWCGRTVSRAGGQCTVTLLPNFLGWVDYFIFLPMVLRWRTSSARAPLLCNIIINYKSVN